MLKKRLQLLQVQVKIHLFVKNYRFHQNKILILSLRFAVCTLSGAPPWAFVLVSWPHRGEFATFTNSKDKCPTNARGEDERAWNWQSHNGRRIVGLARSIGLSPVVLGTFWPLLRFCSTLKHFFAFWAQFEHFFRILGSTCAVFFVICANL